MWDERFLSLAREISKFSKDPSTQVGAVIVRPDKTVASIGFNGFPRRMGDQQERYEDRNEKYSRIIHGEMNAILNAKEPLNKYTLYLWPFLSCDRCAVHVIQSGITRVVAPPLPGRLYDRWGELIGKAKNYYSECGVIVDEIQIS
jgi:dCMP deaminase